MHQRAVACAALMFTLLFGPSVTDAADHFVFGLVPDTPYDAWQEGGVVASGLVPGPAAEIRFRTPNLSPVTILPSSTPPDAIPPARVVDLAVTSTTRRSISIAWTAVGDDGHQGRASLYDIRYATAPITPATWDAASRVTGVPPPAPAGVGETFTLSQLRPNTTYYVALRVADEVPNWSEISNLVTAQTVQSLDPFPPGPIDDLTAGSVEARSVTLEWTSPADDDPDEPATAYDGRYSLDPITEANWDKATAIRGVNYPSIPGTRESHTVDGLEAQTAYYFAMRAIDEAKNVSVLGPILRVETKPPDDEQPPTTPTTVTALLQDDQVQIRWTPSPDPDVEGYLVTRRSAGSGEIETVIYETAVGEAFVDRNIAPDVEYAYSVSARDTAGNESAPTEDVVVQTSLDGFLPVVHDFRADASVAIDESDGAPWLRLVWSAEPALRFAGFTVARSTDGGLTWEERPENLIANGESWLFEERIEAGEFLYRAAAVSPLGYERPFRAVPVRWDPNGRIRVDGPFPNPTPGPAGLRFQLPTQSRVVVRLHDASGRRVAALRDEPVEAGMHTWSVDPNEIEWDRLASGTYFLRIEAGNERFTRKLVIRK